MLYTWFPWKAVYGDKSGTRWRQLKSEATIPRPPSYFKLSTLAAKHDLGRTLNSQKWRSKVSEQILDGLNKALEEEA